MAWESLSIGVHKQRRIASPLHPSPLPLLCGIAAIRLELRVRTPLALSSFNHHPRECPPPTPPRVLSIHLLVSTLRLSLARYIVIVARLGSLSRNFASTVAVIRR